MVKQDSSKNQKPRNPSYMEMKKSEGERQTKDKNELVVLGESSAGYVRRVGTFLLG
jgi:hypothetical protein